MGCEVSDIKTGDAVLDIVATVCESLERVHLVRGGFSQIPGEMQRQQAKKVFLFLFPFSVSSGGLGHWVGRSSGFFLKRKELPNQPPAVNILQEWGAFIRKLKKNKNIFTFGEDFSYSHTYIDTTETGAQLFSSLASFQTQGLQITDIKITLNNLAHETNI